MTWQYSVPLVSFTLRAWCAANSISRHRRSCSAVRLLLVTRVLLRRVQVLPLLGPHCAASIWRSALFSAISRAAFICPSARRASRANLLRSSAARCSDTTPRSSSRSALIGSRCSTFGCPSAAAARCSPPQQQAPWLPWPWPHRRHAFRHQLPHPRPQRRPTRCNLLRPGRSRLLLCSLRLRQHVRCHSRGRRYQWCSWEERVWGS
jgi:hypothetical protein